MLILRAVMDQREDRFSYSEDFENNVLESMQGDIDRLVNSDDDPDELDDEEGRWNYIPTSQLRTSISTNSIDDLLLQTSKAEMTAVASRLLNKLGDAEPSRAAITSFFMDPLVPILSEASNTTTDDVAEFIRCLAAMSIYGKSPTVFFDRRNSDVFPLAHERSEPIFRKVKTGLSQPSMIIYMHCTS